MRVNKMDCNHNFKKSPGGLMQMRNRLIYYIRCERCGLITREDKLRRSFEYPHLHH